MMKLYGLPGKDHWNEIFNKLRRARAVHKHELQSPQHESPEKAEPSSGPKPARLRQIDNLVSRAASGLAWFHSHDYPPPRPRDPSLKNATHLPEEKQRKYLSLLPHQVSTTESKQCPQSRNTEIPMANKPMDPSERRKLSILESQLLEQLRCLATTPTDRNDELVLLGRHAVWMSGYDVNILQDIAALTSRLTLDQKETVLSDLHALLEPEYRYALRQVVMHGVQIVRLGIDDVQSEEHVNSTILGGGEDGPADEAMQDEALDDLYPRPLRIRRRSPPSFEEHLGHQVDDPEPTDSGQSSVTFHAVPGQEGGSQRKGSVSRARAALMDNALTSHFSHRVGDPRHAIGNHGPYPQLSLPGPSSSRPITDKPLPRLPEEEFEPESEQWNSMSFAEQLAASVKPSPARKITFADQNERPMSMRPVFEMNPGIRGGAEEELSAV